MIPPGNVEGFKEARVCRVFGDPGAVEVPGLFRDDLDAIGLRRSMVDETLYAQEYVRMLRDRQLPTPKSEAASDDVPASIQAVIAARLDTLDVSDKAFLQTASVIGRTAWLGATCAVSGLLLVDAKEHLREAERRQLVCLEPRSSIADDIEFSFTHALIRDVAYRQLRRDKRAEKHERAAAWIQQLPGAREDKAELLAHHYTTALRLSKRRIATPLRLSPRRAERQLPPAAKRPR